MLGTIRKFSSSIYAKIFLFIVAIPFIFWGMGDVFRSGNQNVIVKIEKEKIPSQEFVQFVKNYSYSMETVDEEFIEKLLSEFIGDKLIAEEIKKMKIKLSDESLSKIIKNEKLFKKNGEFSRTEYEKFLINNNLSAVYFENNLSKQERKKQLLNLIGGGIRPSNFLINKNYNKIHQDMKIQIINLNNFFKQEFQFTEDQLKKYYNNNLDKFNELYKSINFVELQVKNLTGSDEFSDIFFKKIDEIDDLIVEGKKLKYISTKFNLEEIHSSTFNKNGFNKNSVQVLNVPEILIKKVFDASNEESVYLIEHKDKYFVVEILKTENIQKSFSNKNVKKEILLNFEKEKKSALLLDIINKINKNNFKKSDFEQFSKDKDIPIKNITLENKNDNKILKNELVDQIYLYPEKKVILVADKELLECFLIYIEKIDRALIAKNHNDYDKFLNLSRSKIKNNLYNTYDIYLKEKYNIVINYKALDNIKNYFK